MNVEGNKNDFVCRLVRAQTLTVTFKKPFDSLAETVIAVRSTNDFSEQCSKWWCFLTLARKFFEETLLSLISPHRYTRWIKIDEGKQPTDLSRDELKARFTF